MHLGSLFLCGTLALGLAGMPMARAESVSACGGDNNWPPMSFALPGSKQVEGLSADVLRAIFNDEASLHISLRPWARCLQDVQRNNGFDIVMSLFRNPERDQLFQFSKTYLSLSPAYVYASARYAAPPVQKLADLAKLKVCALPGASTTYTRLPPDAIDVGTNSYASLMGKLDRGYCDVVVEMQEVMLGFAKLGLLPMQTGSYQVALLPETEKYPLHFGVAKDHPHASELVNQLDRGIRELQRSGKLADMLTRYQLNR